MWIDRHLLHPLVWDLTWAQILIKLVAYSLATHFVIIPGVRRLLRLLDDIDQ